MPVDFDSYMKLIMRGGAKAPGLADSVNAQQAIPKEAFIEQAPQKETERGVFSKILNALGAGEYAISSFLKAAIRGREDPFEAALKGFASGFTDDRKYETRMYDVLTELGWKESKTSTFNNVAKFGVGMLAGIIADPITYLSFGPAARAMRVGAKPIAEWARLAGFSASKLGTFGRGQAFTRKVGKPLYEFFFKKHLAEMGEGAAKNMYGVQKAQKLAQFDMLDLAKPLSAGPKDAEKVKLALQFMGKPVTTKSIEEFSKEGFKELLDKGGLKWFGKSIWSPGKKAGYLTPRASSLSGALMGERISSNAPLLTRGMEKVKGTQIWQDLISKPFEKLSKKLNIMHGVPEHLKDLVHDLRGSGAPGQQHLAEEVRNSVTVSWESINKRLGRDVVEAAPKKGGAGKLFSGGKGLPSSTKLDRTLTTSEQEFMSWLMVSMRSRQLPEDQVEEFVTGIFTKKPNYKVASEIAEHEFKISKFSAEGKASVIEAAIRGRRQMEVIRPIAEKVGQGTAVSPAYWPRVYDITEKVDDVARQQRYLGNDPMWFQKEQKALIDPLDIPYTSKDPSARTIKKLVEAGEIPGQFSKNYQEVMQARLGSLYERVYKAEAVDRLLAAAAWDPAAVRVLKDMAEDPAFMAVHPEITRGLARTVSDMGASAADFSKFGDFTRHMARQKTPEAMDDLFEKMVKDSEGFPNLTGKNIDSFMAKFDAAVGQKHHWAKTTTKANAETWEASALHMEGMREKVEGLLTEKGLDNVIGKTQGALEKALTPATQVARQISKEGEEVVKAAEKAYGGDLLIGGVEAATTGKAQETFIQRTREAIKATKAQAAGVPGDQLERIGRNAEAYTWQAGARVDENALSYIDLMEDVKRVTSGSPMAKSPSAVWKKSRDVKARIERQLKTLDTAMTRMGQGGASEAQKSLGGFVYQMERDALLEIQKKLPGTASKRQLEVMDGINRLMHEAKAQGFNTEKYMQGFLKFFGNKKTIAAWSPNELATARKAFEAVTDRDAIKQAKWLLSPPVDEGVTKTLRKLSLTTDFQVADPIFAGKTLKAGEDFVIPDSVAKIIENVMHPEDMPKIPKFFGLIQKITAPFKSLVTVGVWGIPRPAFYLRNIVDVNFRGSIGFGVDWWRTGGHHFSDITKIAAGEAGVLKLKNGVEIPFEQIRQYLAEGGVWRRGFERSGLQNRDKMFRVADYVDKLSKGDGFARNGTFVRDLKRGVSEWIEKSRIPTIGKLEGLSKWNMENMATVTGLISSIESGVPVDQALKRLRDHLFTYNAMSDVERYYVRSLIPFWGFTRNTIPWSIKMFKQKPWVPASVARFSSMTFLSEEDEAKIPQYVRDYPWISLKKKKNGVQLLSMRNTFSIDAVADIFPPMDLESFRKWASQLNPILMAPIEALAGKELYIMRDIHKRRYLTKQLQSGFMKGTVGKLLNAHDVTYRDKPAVAVDGRAWHLLRRLHFSRLFRELDDLSSVIEGKLSPNTLVGMFTGFKIMEVDGERQMQYLQNDAERQYRDYRRAAKAGDTPEVKRLLKEYGLAK